MILKPDMFSGPVSDLFLAQINFGYALSETWRADEKIGLSLHEAERQDRKLINAAWHWIGENTGNIGRERSSSSSCQMQIDGEMVDVGRLAWTEPIPHRSFYLPEDLEKNHARLLAMSFLPANVGGIFSLAMVPGDLVMHQRRSMPIGIFPLPSTLPKGTQT